MSPQLVQCVPNFSEGCDTGIIEQIVAPFRGKPLVKLLDYQRDEDHNRLVVTVLGEPTALEACLMEAAAQAISRIDMRAHHGQHPRMGAVDVVPLIPIRNISMAETVDLSRRVAKALADRFGLPVFLYEAAASSPSRVNLADIREGGFEKMPEKLKIAAWKPDFGPDRVHPTAGVTAVGARKPLVAFNVNLNTDNIDIARKIARAVRFKNGGLRYCKAIGLSLEARRQVQVSMNMTDFSQTALYRAFELIRAEAARFGVAVAGSEIVGLVPLTALVDCAAYYLGLENFSPMQILEMNLISE